MTKRANVKLFGEKSAEYTGGCPCEKGEEKEMAVGPKQICKNCERKIYVNPGGLCAFCECAVKDGMEHGVSREEALKAAKELAPKVRRGMHTKAMFPWYKTEKKKEEKQEVKPESESVTSIDMDREFTVYGSDPTTVTVNGKKKKFDDWKDAGFSSDEEVWALILYFGDDKQLKASIESLAKLHYRTPEAEIRWILSKVVPLYLDNPPKKKAKLLSICREGEAA